MRSFLYFIILVVLLGSILLAVNLLLAPHVPYKEKKTPFECGYHSFNQTRFPIEIKPLIFALMFVIFDVELVSAFPYVVSSMANERFGFVIFIVFVVILCVGFIFELGKGALTIESRQSKDLLTETSSVNKSMYNYTPVKSCVSEIFKYLPKHISRRHNIN